MIVCTCGPSPDSWLCCRSDLFTCVRSILDLLLQWTTSLRWDARTAKPASITSVSPTWSSRGVSAKLWVSLKQSADQKRCRDFLLLVWAFVMWVSPPLASGFQKSLQFSSVQQSAERHHLTAAPLLWVRHVHFAQIKPVFLTRWDLTNLSWLFDWQHRQTAPTLCSRPWESVWSWPTRSERKVQRRRKMWVCPLKFRI